MEPEISYSSEREEIRKRIQLIKQNLPRRISRSEISMTAKIPYKALDYRECLTWRIFELSRDAFVHLETNSFASATILTRAVMESVSAMWYLSQKISSVVESGVVGEIDEYLMRLLVGRRNHPSFPSINVMTFLDYVDGYIPGFRQEYDNLSEFVHPNWAGTTGLYAQINEDEFYTEYGANPRKADSIRLVTAMGLHSCLMLFELIHNKISDMTPRLISICEAELQK